MAEVQFVDNGYEQEYVTIVFDTADLPVLAQAKKADPLFLQKAVTELFTVLARNQNQEALMSQIENVKLGTFGRLGTMKLA